MAETNKLSNKADGFIIEMGKAKILIKAKYPEAPPCPTLAYKKAMTAIKMQNSIKKLVLTSSIFCLLLNRNYGYTLIFFNFFDIERNIN